MKNNNLQLLDDKISEILGAYYYELEDYFCNISNLDYDYKVFLSKRCAVLYNIFCSLNKGKFSEIGKFVSYDYIDLIPANTDKVLLIDDSCITLCEFKNIFDKVQKKVHNVDTKFYMLSMDINFSYISEDMKKSITYVDLCEEEYCLNLLNIITESIYAANKFLNINVGYHSVSVIEDFIEYCNSHFLRVENTDKTRKSIHGYSYIYCYNKELPLFFKSISSYCCFSVYGGAFDENINVVPNVFIKETEKCKVMLNRFSDMLPDSLSSIKKVLSNSGNTLYSLMLFRTVVSRMFLLYSLNDIVDILGMLRVDLLRFYYDNEIIEELKNMTYADIWSIVETEDFSEYFMPVSEMSNIICSNFNEDYAILKEDICSRYLCKYKFPIFIDSFLNRVNDKDKMVGKILSLIDFDCVDLVLKEFICDEVYSFCIIGKVQNIKSLLIDYPFIIRKFIFLEERGEDFTLYLNNLLKWLEGELSKEDYAKIDYDLNLFADMYSDCIMFTNMLSIVENISYWDRVKIEKIREFNKKFFAGQRGYRIK